jgi:hypothetical protein
LGKINSPKSLTNAWWWILTFVGVVVAAFMVLILLGRKKEKGWGHAFQVRTRDKVKGPSSIVGRPLIHTQLCKFWEYDWREICKCSRRWVIGGVGKG